MDGGHVARMGERRSVCGDFGRETWGKRPLGRPRRRWEDNIEMDHSGITIWGVRTGSIWLRIRIGGGHLNAVMNLRLPYNAGNFLTSWGPVSFSRRILLHGISKSSYLLPRTSKHLPQCPILEQLSQRVLPSIRHTKFHTHIKQYTKL